MKSKDTQRTATLTRVLNGVGEVEIAIRRRGHLKSFKGHSKRNLPKVQDPSVAQNSRHARVLTQRYFWHLKRPSSSQSLRTCNFHKFIRRTVRRDRVTVPEISHWRHENHDHPFHCQEKQLLRLDFVVGSAVRTTLPILKSAFLQAQTGLNRPPPV